MTSKEIRIKNLKHSSEKSHRLADTALKEALYQLLTRKEINQITVTELIKLAGVSRSTYYKHYYYLTDLLNDDLDELINNVIDSFTSDLYNNWLIIFNKVYECKDKLALIYKAGLSISFLRKLNDYYKGHENEDTYIICNGIVFNSIYNWGINGFKKSPKKLAKEITEVTKPLFMDNS